MICDLTVAGFTPCPFPVVAGACYIVKLIWNCCYAQHHSAIKELPRFPNHSFARRLHWVPSLAKNSDVKLPSRITANWLPWFINIISLLRLLCFCPNLSHPFHPKPGDGEQSRIFSITSVTLAARLCLPDGFWVNHGGLLQQENHSFADKLKWAYNPSTSNEVQHHFHQYISLKYSDLTFARNLLWNLGCSQCCEYTARLAYKKLTFPVGWSLSQPVLCPLAFILLQLCLAQQNQLLETLGHSILELESCHPLRSYTKSKPGKMEWHPKNEQIHIWMVQNESWTILDIVSLGEIIWNQPLFQIPYHATWTSFPHYRTRSKVLLFPRCRPPSPEIRDVYRYGWINNKSIQIIQ